jgi:NAD(P)-dependent dehydrogenase (short-subunit alcohol dehydrogenase family)
MRLAGKHAMITGAAQGIGLAIAAAFAREGAALLLVDRDAAALEASVAGLRACDVPIRAVAADITDAAAIAQAVRDAEAGFRPLDTLVNNAGINVFRDPLTLSDADWQLCLDVDLKGAWNCARAVLPSLIAGQGGAIVNIASTHAFSIIPGCFPYPVAKHGLIGLTRALAIEYAAKNVRVNAIAPGYVETQKAIDWWNTFADPAAARAKTLALHPPKRICSPQEVAMTALFLASDEAPFINGATIPIDGGRSILYHE